MNFQEMILRLQGYWASQGCCLVQPLDLEVGAGTFHPATFLRALGPKPWNTAYVQPCRRPADGRYGENPNRVQHYYQFQVLMKPSVDDILERYRASLTMLGLDLAKHDLRFVEDNWESPTLGAWGLGWEVWLDGMEVTQFTYFQQVGGFPCQPVSVEITYGLERLAMYLQGVHSFFDIVWSEHPRVTYGDVFLDNEKQMSAYHFEYADVPTLFHDFHRFFEASEALLSHQLCLPAYEMTMKASHTFNILDARGALSVSERQRLLLNVRKMARRVAEQYVALQEGISYAT